jgi:hypothetical protein
MCDGAVDLGRQDVLGKDACYDKTDVFVVEPRGALGVQLLQLSYAAAVVLMLLDVSMNHWICTSPP